MTGRACLAEATLTDICVSKPSFSARGQARAARDCFSAIASYKLNLVVKGKPFYTVQVSLETYSILLSD